MCDEIWSENPLLCHGMCYDESIIIEEMDGEWMSEPIIKHQSFEYREEMPFQIYNVSSIAQEYLEEGAMLVNHWHEELEIAYGLLGNDYHYINGECVVSQPGRLVVTNSEFIHSIIPDEKVMHLKAHVSVVVIIHPRFLQENFPRYNQIYFTNDKELASPEIQRIMEKISAYVAASEKGEYDYLYIRGLVLLLLYEMCREGVVERDKVDNVNLQKNIERMKGVFSFIENHYKEHISQAEVAEKFYFSTVYFSRYFKKCAGMTFTDYLMNYRLQKARMDLLYTDKSVSEIAMDCGFSDDRRLIISFKKKYGTTPLQFKKSKKQQDISEK